MKFILLILALFFIGCAPDGGETTVNVADNGAQSGDPVTDTDTNTECVGSDEDCNASD